MAAIRRRVHMSMLMNLPFYFLCLYFAASLGRAAPPYNHPDKDVKMANSHLNQIPEKKLTGDGGEPMHFGGGKKQPDHVPVHPNQGGVEHMDQGRQHGGSKQGHKTSKMHRVKISESEACGAEVQKYCSNKGISDNNFAQLDCLQNDLKVDEQLSDACHHFLWQYKRNLTTDDRFSYASAEVCQDELNRIPECKASQNSKGHLIPCLLDHKENITSTNCKQFLNKMASIVFSDYRLVYNFVETCQADIDKYACGRVQRTNEDHDEEEMAHSQGHTLDCLEKHAKDLDDRCKLQVLRVAELQADDYHFDRPLYFACREAREIFCAETPAGEGNVYKCLYKHKMNPKMDPKCREQLVKRQKIIAEDVKVDKSFFGSCKQDIKDYECFKHLPRGLDAGRSTVLLCLENIHKKGKPIAAECLGEMDRLRESMLEDFQITPDIVSKCHNEISSFCGNTLQKGGETLHCLMDLATPKHRKNKNRDHSKDMSSECKRELEELIQEADVGENYMMDVALHRACQPVVDSECKHADPENSGVLNCLMEKLDSNSMTPECAERLLEIQYFVVRDFRLDDQLYKKCHKDALEFSCAEGEWNSDDPKTVGANRGPLVLPCLYRHFRKIEGRQISKECKHEVKRVMRNRAKNVDLMPEIEDQCMIDLGDKCSNLEDYNKGEEMKCLEDNYDDLGEECKEAVGKYIEEEDEDLDLDLVLKKACLPMIQKFCGDVDEDDDAFGILECLIENKHHSGMDDKCAAGVEHHQIISLKDIKFSHKFKEHCKQYVEGNEVCSTHKKNKMEIVSCLSEVVRNDTLFGKPHRIAKPCRKQLKAQLLQREESIKLDPVLKQACMEDVKNFCHDKQEGEAKVIECLRKVQPKLSPKCHKVIFNQEKNDLIIADYALQKACKGMIKEYCDSVTDPVKILPCLRSYKSKPGFDSACRKIVVQRQIVQNIDYRNNPGLQTSCKRDIPKFCSHILMEQQEDEELEGKVINCLKEVFVKRRLTSDCSREIEVIMKEAAADYRQDPVLANACKDEIAKHCEKEMEEVKSDDGGNGIVEECLKNKFHDKLLKNANCIKQVARLIQEGHVDVHVDVELHKTCSKDLSYHCADTVPGEGRLMACLLGTLESYPLKLRPNCRKMLKGRKDMWEYAAQVAPIESVQELYDQISVSPSRNYILGILISIVGIIFIMGISCGRVTKRITREMKNR